MEVHIKDRQNLLDMALQTSGSLEAAFALAANNDTSLTAVLPDGRTLQTVSVESPSVVNRYTRENIYPATVMSHEEETTLTQEGIHFMGIEIDFIVS